MGIAHWPLIGLAVLCACSAGKDRTGAARAEVPVRPGLWETVTLDGGVPDPQSRVEECHSEDTWFAMASLSSGSREMGCSPLEPVTLRNALDRTSAAREVCRQGGKTVVRIVTLEVDTDAPMPLSAFEEVTRLRVKGQSGEEISRTRHVWLGACPGPTGEMLGRMPATLHPMLRWFSLVVPF